MKWMKKHKIITGFLILILLLILFVFWFLWSKLDLIQYDNEIDKSVYESVAVDDIVEELVTSSDIEGLKQVQSAPVIPEAEILKEDDILNILLIGTDERTWEFSHSARSDAMILVSINKTDKTVKLVSLERGMGAPVLAGEYEGQWDWLTHIFRYGGSDLLLETVQTCFRIEIDHYVRINFRTVITAVDAIGGIDIEMSESEAWYFNCLYEAGVIDTSMQVGMNHLDGENALAFARLREIDSDWQRVGRQRRVIIAAVNALKNASIGELNALADQMLPLVQTNFTKAEIVELMIYAPNFLRSTFDQMTIPAQGTYGAALGMGGRYYFAADFEENSRILREFLYGKVE